MSEGLNRGAIKCLFIVLMFTMVGGCGLKYRSEILYVTKPYKEGRFEEAQENAARIEKNGEKRDKLALVLEEGAAMQASGRFKQSNEIFDRADKIFEDMETGADVSVSNETAGVLFSPAAMTYRGYGYDRIMINVDKALNDWALGDKDGARTEIVRLDASQQACERRYAKQIEEAKAAQGKNSDVDSDPNKVRKDEKFQAGEKQVFEDFGDDNSLNGSTPIENESYKDVYTNPFAEYLKAVFYSYSNGPGEAEQARVALRHVVGMAPSNSYLAHDLADAELVANFKKVAPKTYVFFETGMAPTRKEIRIDLPIFVLNVAVKDTKVDYVGIAFPQLKKDNDFHEYIVATTAVDNFKTEVLADMDKIVAREFKHELPTIITRLVISEGIKVAASYAVAKSTERQNIWVQIAARGGMAAFNAANNEADLRTWHTLPKQIQMADFTTPEDGVVKLELPNGRSAGTVKVLPGKANVIWVCDPSRYAQATVRSFSIN